MKRRARIVALGLYCLLGALPTVTIAVLAGCGGQQQSAVAKPETLLDTRCAECHDLSQVKAVKQDRAGWERTVERMIGKGARLNDEEKKVLIDHLTSTQGQ